LFFLGCIWGLNSEPYAYYVVDALPFEPCIQPAMNILIYSFLGSCPFISLEKIYRRSGRLHLKYLYNIAKQLSRKVEPT
jgi:hypothetical protein